MKNSFLNFSRPREAHRRENLTLQSIGNCNHCQAIARQLPIACGRNLHFGNPMILAQPGFPPEFATYSFNTACSSFTLGTAWCDNPQDPKLAAALQFNSRAK
jgi:hypothetical protein